MFKHIIFIWIVSLSILSNAYAQEICPLPQNIKPKGISSLKYFKTIAVFDEGRIEPVDTYARNFLIQLSGKNSFNHEPAIRWLAKLLFAPEIIRNDKVFLINSAEVLSKLAIIPQTGDLYSFSQIEPKLGFLIDLARSSHEIRKGDRNVFGRDIIRLYKNIVVYTNLANSFAFAVPSIDFQVNNEDVVLLLELPNGRNLYSFFDIASKSEDIMLATESVDQKDIEDRSPKEKELLRLLGNLFRWSMEYENNAFQIIPTFDLQDYSLLSPWKAINSDFQKKEIQNELNYLRNIVVHYWNGEQVQFDMALKLFQSSLINRVDSSEGEKFGGLKFKIEIFNNQLNPLWWVKMLYGSAVLLSFLGLFFKKMPLRYILMLLVLLGFVFHLWLVISSAIVMSRSPLENPYEFFSLLGLMSVFVGFVIVAWKRGKRLVI